MEFLDINLDIHSPFYWRIVKEPKLFSGFKNPFKRFRTRKLEYIHAQHFAERYNEGRKPDKKSSLRDPSFCPEASTKYAIKEFLLLFKALIS